MIPYSWRSAEMAALQPLTPCTPGPGGVEAEQRYIPLPPGACQGSAARTGRLGRRHLLARATQVDRARRGQPLGCPRHGPGQRVVHLRGGVAVPEAEQSPDVGDGQPVTGDADHGAGSGVEEDGTRGWEVGEGRHLDAGEEGGTVGAGVVSQSVGAASSRHAIAARSRVMPWA